MYRSDCKHILEWLCNNRVSILILMDVSFWQKHKEAPSQDKESFNPYFNGCIVLTCFGLICIIIPCRVSILILMDVSFWLRLWNISYPDIICFNPYFNGCIVLTIPRFWTKPTPFCFNPYFNGCIVLTYVAV